MRWDAGEMEPKSWMPTEWQTRGWDGVAFYGLWSSRLGIPKQCTPYFSVLALSPV